MHSHHKKQSMVKYIFDNNHSCLENKDNVGAIYKHGFTSCRSFHK